MIEGADRTGVRLTSDRLSGLVDFAFSLTSDLPRCLISATMMLRYLYDMALDNFDRSETFLGSAFQLPAKSLERKRTRKRTCTRMTV